MNSIKECKGQIKSKLDILDIKSNFIIKIIFSYMQRNKQLEIIRYNKKAQNRFDLSLNDFKEYSQLYSTIKIELKLTDNEKNKYRKFINISQSNKKYIHVYFDNSHKEINRNQLKRNEKVKTVQIVIDHQIKSLKDLFSYCDSINSICFKKFTRINITDMSFMFYECLLLEDINLSIFNTNNVTNMRFMFYGCSSLKELNLSSFNTNNVTDMSSMFSGCSSLKELNLTNFDTLNVTNMNFMFNECSMLNELNLSNFKTNYAKSMRFMFNGCSALKELNIENFDTNNVTNMSNMFSGCSSLKELNISYFNTNSVTNKNKMLFECSDELKKKINELIKN